MRTTPTVIFNRLLGGFQKNFRAMFEAQGKLSSGKRIEKPSDDVIGLSKALGYKLSINASEQFGRNIDEAESRLNFVEGTLDSVSETLMRAKELALQGVNATENAESREAIAEEVAHLREQLLGLANSRLGGQYVFSGYKTGTPAFDLTTWAYQGDSGEMNIAVDRDSYTATNIPGSTAFGYALAAEEVVQLEDGRVLHYIPGETVLEGNDITAPGSDQTLAFTVTGRLGSATVNVAISASDNPADIATKITDAVNLEKDNTGVSARDGGGGTSVDLYDAGRGDIVVSGIDTGGNEDDWSGFPEGMTTVQGADAVRVEVRDTDDLTVLDSFSFDNFIQMTDILSGALSSDNAQRVEALLNPLEEALGQVSNVRADVGARLGSLEAGRERLLDGKLLLEQNLSAVEDADIVETTIELSKAEIALQSLRDSAARLLSQSLMDFLK